MPSDNDDPVSTTSSVGYSVARSETIGISRSKADCINTSRSWYVSGETWTGPDPCPAPEQDEHLLQAVDRMAARGKSVASMIRACGWHSRDFKDLAIFLRVNRDLKDLSALERTAFFARARFLFADIETLRLTFEGMEKGHV